jgi:AcrR family transcriptional regulator
MTKSSARTRFNDPVGMRNRVIDVAAAAFQAGGYKATSINDILKASGVSGGALHHHFPTKKVLIAAVLRERVAVEVDTTWAGTVRKAPTAIAGILAVFETVADALDEQGSVSGCPLGNFALELALTDEELRAMIGVEYEKWRNAIVEKIRSEDAGIADPRAFALMVIALFTGAMSLAKVEQTGSALRSCAAQLRTLLKPPRKAR